MSYFDVWWKENRPDMPVDMYHVMKELCKNAWERSKEEENARATCPQKMWITDNCHYKRL